MNRVFLFGEDRHKFQKVLFKTAFQLFQRLALLHPLPKVGGKPQLDLEILKYLD